MKRKHILIVANNIDGGIHTFLQQIIHLQTKQMPLSLLTLRSEVHTVLPPFSFKASFQKVNENNHFIMLLKEFFWLKTHISEQHPDVILSIDTHASLLVCLLKKLFFKKTPLIISNRNNVREISKEKFSPLLQGFIQIFGHYLFPQATKIICVSHGLAEDFKAYFSLKKPVDYIYNGIDVHTTTILGRTSIDVQDKIFFTSPKKTVISIGRLEKQKDFETLIQAIKLVTKTIPGIQLLIIGDGSQKEKLKNLINSLNLDHSVYLLGWRKNVYPYLKEADLFVLSSHYEGFGYVLLEAMSQGVPIISTDSPFGPAEVLSSNTYGILTPVKNPNTMAKHIGMLLQNKTMHISLATQAKKRVSYFSHRGMLVQYKKIFNDQ